MSSTLRPGRLLSEAFELDLLSGTLEPLLQLVKRDRDLIAEIRANLLDVYCKGQRLISIAPTSRQGGYILKSSKKFWTLGNLRINNADEARRFCEETVPFIKQRISEHHSEGREIEFEQLLIRANSIEKFNTDYIAVDRQGVSDDRANRIDVIGVYWPGGKRHVATTLAPALIEVKLGQKGGVEDVANQLRRYFEDLERTIESLAAALQAQFRQKGRLGLLSGLSDLALRKIAQLPISTRIEDVRAVVALVDYNPRARRLSMQTLQNLPFSNQIDLFYVGMGLWKQNSAFATAAPPVDVDRVVSSDWLQHVAAGDFSSIPAPFSWLNSVEFAHLIHGYDAAKTLGIGDLGPFANAKLDAANLSGEWSGTAAELWLCLFYEHRRARHAGEPESYASDATELDTLCETLRVKLQQMGRNETHIILSWIADAASRNP